VTAEARQAQLDERAAALGRTWASSCRRDLGREGRAACGGWPGTLNEARARVREMLASARNPGGYTEAEREHAARAVYRSARDEWRRHSVPEGD
jgi:hypothetical protein